jgi:hypothetical protein
MERLARLRRLSPTERHVLALAWGLLVVVPVLLRMVPLHRLLPAPHAGREALLPPARVASLVHIAARWAPGATCLPIAVVTARLLARQGTPSTLRIGVARQPGCLMAHAWVECADVPLTDADETKGYQPLLTVTVPH